MSNISYENLKESHPQTADILWRRICEIGGFGEILTTSTGGLDVSGLDDKKKKEIAALLGTKEGK